MLPCIPEISLSIIKMKESSGNIQYFAKAYRTDVKHTSAIDRIASGLDIACWQTKSLRKTECLSRIWFDISYSARFYGIPMEEVNLLGLTAKEKSFIVNQMTIRS